MNRFNNFSILPFYSSLDEQNAYKWWVYGRVYPLFASANFLLPFQILFQSDENPFDVVVNIWDKDRNGYGSFYSYGLQTEVLDFGDYKAVVFDGKQLMQPNLPIGQYFLTVEIAFDEYSIDLYSEMFTVVADMSPYLKIEWWDEQDLVFDAGRIIYKTTDKRYKQFLYLDADIAKPEYIFEDESEERDGYTFPIKQISEKRYKFSFLASEYLLDVMRFIRMADFVQITYQGKTFLPDSFLITPEWEKEGDVAVVKAEFDTDTVVKKLGLGYLRPTGGDFNVDYGPDEIPDFNT